MNLDVRECVPSAVEMEKSTSSLGRLKSQRQFEESKKETKYMNCVKISLSHDSFVKFPATVQWIVVITIRTLRRHWHAYMWSQLSLCVSMLIYT